MGDLFHTFILGIVQGLTEFLPISSSGHLAILPRIFHWPDHGLAFDVALHLGTLAAVVVYFWKDIVQLTKGVLYFKDPALVPERRMVGYLLLATIPAGVAGLLLEDIAETTFRSPLLIACVLIGMGLLLGIADYTSRGHKTLSDLSWKTALVLGVAQAFALIPGTSRSGVTITMALFIGLNRTNAARFSFLMSLPVIAGAGLLKLDDILLAPDRLAIAVGFLAAAVSGFLAIWVLIKYVQNHRYTPFVIYRFILGTLILLNLHKLQ
jgi:undecaprenyl-diphosphatase